jgi:hypothetical protein
MASQWVLPEVEEGLFELFRQAVQDERQALHVYAMALTLCADPDRRSVLQGLIDEATKWHAQIVMDRFNALLMQDVAGSAAADGGRSTPAPERAAH